jgi:hypothetical protein
MCATIQLQALRPGGRYEVSVPDNKVRLDAVQTLPHEGLGRPGEAEAQPASSLPNSRMRCAR